ncbi:PcsB-like coiled-coil domain-containing protein [Gracilibacillus kekensis]|uniref:N-terminal domain of peptidoglycan hydrolase CwlO-containing protein n=1 Tax=Gracilibacillus kekensis TaxID=1027249 RepID=A0A1M7MSY0_9BACI|nr:C40 family peptidase [Gracilibacillus kekensis]SHM94112.1 N-terminal domain of peptidoglycan hydrolase CwlO-containing protein [Gracilibacillus kekensis]
MPEIKGLVKNSVVAVTVMSSLFFVQSVSAETEEEIQAQRSEIQSDIDIKEEELNKIKEELVELNEDIIRYEEAIEANEEVIAETEEEMQSVEAEVEKLEKRVAEIQKNIDRRNDILKERISSLQENGGSSSYIEVVFGATSFVDFIDRVSLVHKITQADQDLLESQEQDKLEVEKSKVELDNKLEDLQSMKTEYEEMQKQIVAQKEKNEELKEELSKKEEENSDVLEDLKIEDQVLANKEKALKEAEEQMANNSSSSRSNGSSNNGAIQQYASSSSAPVSASSGALQTAMTVGNRYIGNSVYVFGGGRTASDIANGRFDCSGFVSWAFRQAGISLPASTSGLSSVGTKVSMSEAKPGDLVFFNTYKTNGHVGIYLGNNKFIGAQSSTGVAVASMSGYWSSTFSGHVRRVAQ